MLKYTLLAASALVLAATAAPAQDYDNDPGYQNGPAETVEVIAPRLRTDNSSLAPTAYTHLSVQVRYDDLNLTTRSGAGELKARIRDAAHNVCEELSFRFPHAIVGDPPCYQTAVSAAMLRADNAISSARDYTYAGYEE